MRTGFLISLLFIFLVKAEGIRMQYDILSSVVDHQNIQEQKAKLIAAANVDSGEREEILCKNCQGSGRINRKLMTKTSSPTTTPSSKTMRSGGKTNPTSKQQPTYHGLGGNEENFTVNSPNSSVHPKGGAPEQYPDIIDIAGMDYSPAKRKPPIHN